MRRRGRPPIWTREQRAQVLALATEGTSQRAIAESVFGDAAYRGRVERILHEQAISPRGDGGHLSAEDAIDEAFEAGDMSSVRALLARYERALLFSEEVPAIADIERLLRIKRQLDASDAVERANALTRRPREPRPEPGTSPPSRA